MPAPTRHYLDFERPIADLEAKIDELSNLSRTAGAKDFDGEISALRARKMASVLIAEHRPVEPADVGEAVS